ncbi:unnamed protein product [Mytilus edulis]|uniref:Uncharacterized protein n=1 Tax=Mytilus edulis TaxID=6550 RepID=A0A8S3Q7F4_MYTED|nr:unnamed protein product [Mytilus edulis]
MPTIPPSRRDRKSTFIIIPNGQHTWSIPDCKLLAWEFAASQLEHHSTGEFQHTSITKIKKKDIQLSEELSDVSDEDEPIPQLVVGKKKSDSQGDNNTITVSVGEMVLLNLKEYEKEWPQVAQVINFEEETCMIHWFRGSKTKPWKPCSRVIQGKKGKREAWTQTINKTEIIRNSFCLTKGGFLPKNVKEFCKSHELQAKI